MEPIEAKIIYTFNARVKAVEERFAKRWLGGVGRDAVFKDASLGWFVFYDGSWEGINVGRVAPSFGVGDMIKITMEKINGTT